MRLTRCTMVAAWAVAVWVGSWGVPAARAEEPLVFVNLDRVFSEFYRTKVADAQLKEQAEQFNQERKSLVEEYEKLQGVFNTAREEAQNTALSEEARSQKKSEAEEKLVGMRDQEARIRRFDESRRKQLEDQSLRMRKRIVDEIRDTIRTYARNQGLRAVLDSSGKTANGVESVLYSDLRLDITDTVLELLNKGQVREGALPTTPASLPKAAAPAGVAPAAPALPAAPASEKK